MKRMSTKQIIIFIPIFFILILSSVFIIYGIKNLAIFSEFSNEFFQTQTFTGYLYTALLFSTIGGMAYQEALKAVDIFITVE